MIVNFDLNDEQRILRDTVQRFVDTDYDFDTRRRIEASESGFSPSHWARFANLGLLAIPFEERHGGLAGSPVEVAIVMKAFGRALVLEPYIATVVLAGGLLRLGAPKPLQDLIIPGIVQGRCTCAFAYAEPRSRYNLACVETHARKEGSAYVLSGVKVTVHGAAVTDWIILTARTAGKPRDEHGISLFCVPASAQGLSRQDYATIDGARASNIALNDVHVSADNVIGTIDCALPLVERAVEEAIAAHCAEAVGAMEVLIERTIEYVKQRHAFGQSISKFQVIQHRLVNMSLAAEQAAALVIAANLAVAERSSERARLVSAAKAKIGREGRRIAQDAVQLHGGVGITDELSIGHYMKRLMAIDAVFGDQAYHLRRFADLSVEAA